MSWNDVCPLFLFSSHFLLWCWNRNFPENYINVLTDDALVSSQWRHHDHRWRLKSPASWLFTQAFIQTQIKENINAPRHWPLCGEFTGDRWIPRTKGQYRGKCFHLMTSSLRWRHNGRDGVSNHQPHECLLNRLFRRRSKKTAKLCVTGLCAGKSPGPVNSPHKWPVTRKIFPFHDVNMIMSCSSVISSHSTKYDKQINKKLHVF